MVSPVVHISSPSPVNIDSHFVEGFLEKLIGSQSVYLFGRNFSRNFCSHVYITGAIEFVDVFL